MKNIHKKRNLFGLIYALIMLLPMSSILVRCLYVTFNKNAFESYNYQESISNIQIVGNYTTTETPITFVAPSTLNNQYDTGVHVLNFAGSDVKVRPQIINEVWGIDDSVVVSNYQIGMSNNGQQINLLYAGSWHNKPNLWGVTIKELTFTFNSGVSILGYNDSLTNYYAYQTMYTKTSTLDDVFEYSLQTFVNDRGRGVLNLTDWFTSVFLEQNSHNQLYLDFVNWYMNYTLLISCVYLLYLVLMWFISLARRILTKYEEI